MIYTLQDIQKQPIKFMGLTIQFLETLSFNENFSTAKIEKIELDRNSKQPIAVYLLNTDDIIRVPINQGNNHLSFEVEASGLLNNYLNNPLSNSYTYTQYLELLVSTNTQDSSFPQSLLKELLPKEIVLSLYESHFKELKGHLLEEFVSSDEFKKVIRQKLESIIYNEMSLYKTHSHIFGSGFLRYYASKSGIQVIDFKDFFLRKIEEIIISDIQQKFKGGFNYGK